MCVCVFVGCSSVCLLRLFRVFLVGVIFRVDETWASSNPGQIIPDDGLRMPKVSAKGSP